MKINEEDLGEYFKNIKDDLSKCQSSDKGVQELQKIKTRLLGCDASSFNGLYADFLCFLLNNLNSKWHRDLSESQEKEYFDAFFLEGFPEESFVTLVRVIAETAPCNKLDKALNLMKDFMTSSAVREMFLRQCHPVTDPVRKEIRAEIWKDTVTYLVSLPERLSNKMQKLQINDIFSQDSYFVNLAAIITWCLEKVHELLSASVDCSTEFLSRVLGRSCLAWRADAIMPPIMAFLTPNAQGDYIWRRIAQKLFTGVPDNCLETVIAFFFMTNPWYKTISHILGNTALDNPKLNFLLTHKLVLVRCFENVLILQNIFGYLADDASRRKTLVKVLLDVLEVWGNKSNLKHRPYAQHVYITKALLVGLGHLNQAEKDRSKEAILEKLMHAMDSHLSSPLPQIRKLGMVVTACASRTVDPNGPQPDFSFIRDEEVETLEALLVPPSAPAVEELSRKAAGVSVHEKEVAADAKCETSPETKPPAEVLDSDDDEDELQPYDMSNDTPLSKSKRPRYLRDCMQGLVEQEDPELVETCLEAAEPLIRSGAVGLSDVAVELAKILLHLEDSLAIENFLTLRFGALTAVTVACPKLVAGYLAEQFYESNYNVRQRLDVLEILVAAAKELAEAKTSNAVAKVSSPGPGRAHSPLPTTENWREIVQKRIESKTRRFGKGPSKPPPPEVSNRFAPVAGYFFFPLLRSFNHNIKTFDLLGSEFYVLGRLAFSLGMILHAAVNTNIVMQMSQALLEFFWTVRYHTDAYVRRGIVFGLSMVALSVPSHFLLSCLQESLFHWREWLQEVITKDTDIECKQLAVQALGFLDSTIRGASCLE